MWTDRWIAAHAVDEQKQKKDHKSIFIENHLWSATVSIILINWKCSPVAGPRTNVWDEVKSWIGLRWILSGSLPSQKCYQVSQVKAFDIIQIRTMLFKRQRAKYLTLIVQRHVGTWAGSVSHCRHTLHHQDQDKKGRILASTGLLGTIIPRLQFCCRRFVVSAPDMTRCCWSFGGIAWHLIMDGDQMEFRSHKSLRCDCDFEVEPWHGLEILSRVAVR